jgi:hypothetical protein
LFPGFLEAQVFGPLTQVQVRLAHTGLPRFENSRSVEVTNKQALPYRAAVSLTKNPIFVFRFRRPQRLPNGINDHFEPRRISFRAHPICVRAASEGGAGRCDQLD